MRQCQQPDSQILTDFKICCCKNLQWSNGSRLKFAFGISEKVKHKAQLNKTSNRISFHTIT